MGTESEVDGPWAARIVARMHAWVWGEFHPDVWEQAKLEWRGHLTLETLILLQAFGRLEM